MVEFQEAFHTNKTYSGGVIFLLLSSPDNPPHVHLFVYKCSLIFPLMHLVFFSLVAVTFSSSAGCVVLVHFQPLQVDSSS